MIFQLKLLIICIIVSVALFVVVCLLDKVKKKYDTSPHIYYDDPRVLEEAKKIAHSLYTFFGGLWMLSWVAIVVSLIALIVAL